VEPVLPLWQTGAREDAGASGRFGEGFVRYAASSWVIVGMITGQLIRSFLPEREPKAAPEDSIAAVTRMAAWMIAALVAICLVGVVGAALR
jgi:fatty acid desaturase